ncbi:pyrimidine-nucleoside phosphorylase [Lachnospira pectinoschiza]|uniref:Pyrimidine-nucleoside phosphorylase n=1 Tax=Lachnospira pectinoschiza TaxID=28052 RepID=A0A1G9VQ32_9FIRM|nr:pyrimidine-nucleoside phosphorylase [Lachnospira pectinoschiza]SDM73935.1 pyrimidine-nucleoside phosphorylase [Lachnospira pectinoschiza]
MRMVDLIEKKRNKEKLSKEEIDFIIKSYTAGEIPDYQMSALLMAIYFNKMDKEETLNLTLAMRDSGDILDLSEIKGIKVDKHSTGGVGDKTTLVLGPMLAACGLKLAKMSGRGLGHTGGTIDKMESIPGFKTSLSMEAFVKQVNELGIAITGQTGNLAPADKKIYALRDVTATVENISLIASSIMSKKLASGADSICLDVKVGSGAFMKTIEDAKKLASAMVEIGKGAGKSTIAIISEMDEPLGLAVGNSLEVREVIESLKGRGPKDLMELVYCLGSYMIKSAKPEVSLADARNMLEASITEGTALEKFKAFVKAQGGDENVANDYSLLNIAPRVIEVLSKEEGYVAHIQSDLVGHASMILGGGRQRKEDTIDYGVGIELNKKVSDKVLENELLAKIYVNDETNLASAIDDIYEAFRIEKEGIKEPVLIKEIVE